MHKSQFELFKTRRFLPLFLAQFLGAFNDNVFKNALIILISYKLATTSPLQEKLMTLLAQGIFILPFFLFSAYAGQLADKYSKSKLIILVKVFEIIFMVLAAIGFQQNNLTLLMSVLFLMGTHSAFFGPLKYAILPEQLSENELIAGNGFIEGSTFISILLGTILGGLLIVTETGTILVWLMTISVALAGLITSFFVPRTLSIESNLKINLNFIKETVTIIKHTKQEHDVFNAILAISWFWLIGATILFQLPNFIRYVLHADPSVVTLFLALFSIGIAIGSIVCNRLLKGKITAKFVPVSILAISFFMFDLYLVSRGISVNDTQNLMGLGEFFLNTKHWHIAIDMLMIAGFGGIYTVPLYAIIQTRTKTIHRARTVSCNNILNTIFMVVATILIMLLLKLNFTISQIFLVVAMVNTLVAVYACLLLPQTLIKSLLKKLLKFCYRVEINGLENYTQAGNRIIIIANHISFLDAVLLATFLPDKLMFALNSYMAKKWWIQPLHKMLEIFPLDPTNPMATKPLIKAIRDDKHCVIFPEGRITVTGSLMKIYEGPGMIADKTHAKLLPIRIDGAQYTPFSRLQNKYKMHWFPKITILILPPVQLTIDATIKGRVRRQAISRQLYDVMRGMLFNSSNYQKTLFAALIDARKLHGDSHVITEDVNRQPLNYQQLITRSFILGNYLSGTTLRGEAVGILLPTTSAATIVFLALQAYGRVAAMLNFSSGLNNLLLACQTAKINVICTAHKFIEAAKLDDTINKLVDAGIQIIYLEDLRQEISWVDKLKSLIASYFPQYFYSKNVPFLLPNEPATILFTSGSEGTPKAVVLSHANILANIYQVAACVDFTPQDILFNALPIFHSFGLVVGTLLPIFFGIRTFLYPSPLHYRLVPEMIYESNATITFATDTFLSAYGKYANPYDFYSLRYVFAGAEKCKEQTRKLWAEKFGIRILEGYGVTEAAPVISVNTLMQNKMGTVGRMMPGMEYKIEPLEGIAEGGKLIVKGPNVMLGYMMVDQPGKIIPPKDGWYDTGDVVTIDEQGFLTINDRVKRFAKIGGEMISLTAVENIIALLWPEKKHAVLSMPDSRKGEQLILITEYKDATREAIIHYFHEHGIAELSLPRKIKIIDKLFLLGTGKIAYVATKKWLVEHLDAQNI